MPVKNLCSNPASLEVYWGTPLSLSTYSENLKPYFAIAFSATDLLLGVYSVCLTITCYRAVSLREKF